MAKQRMTAERAKAHPSPKEFLAFVEGKLPRRRNVSIEAHVKHCRACGEQLERTCTVVQQRADVDLDIRIGAVLERFSGLFQRIVRERSVAKAAMHGRTKGRRRKSQRTRNAER